MDRTGVSAWPLPLAGDGVWFEEEHRRLLMESIRRFCLMAKVCMITRTERRRRWSEDEKRRIVAEVGGPVR